MKPFLTISFLCLLLISCQNKPKEIQAQTNGKTTVDFSPTVAIETPKPSSFQEAVHRVKVLEILDADPYSYLNVSEGTETYWIAIRKQEVEIGNEYYFSKGLLKTGFESKTHQKTFDKLYLVSKLVALDHSKTAVSKSTSDKKFVIVNDPPSTDTAGVVPISELLEHKESYAGNHIIIHGTITKINPEIMNRNWIHIKDGTADDYDLVVTSSELFNVGETVTISAHVVLNKDFGAGYSYPLILENAKAIH